MTIVVFMGMILIESLFEGAMEYRAEAKKTNKRR